MYSMGSGASTQTLEERGRKQMTKKELIELILETDPAQNTDSRLKYLRSLQHSELVFLVYSMIHHGYKFQPPSAPPL